MRIRIVLTIVALAFALAFAGKKAEESERAVSANEVPAAARAALEKVAAGAALTAFSAEVEHGHTFYEGSFTASSGHGVDALVTPTGDLVEIEERVDLAGVPGAVAQAAKTAAGQAELRFEKKTLVLYEVKFRQGSRVHELVLTPDARRVEEEVERAGEEND
jgi:hypothetical protein